MSADSSSSSSSSSSDRWAAKAGAPLASRHYFNTLSCKTQPASSNHSRAVPLKAVLMQGRIADFVVDSPMVIGHESAGCVVPR